MLHKGLKIGNYCNKEFLGYVSVREAIKLHPFGTNAKWSGAYARVYVLNKGCNSIAPQAHIYPAIVLLALYFLS